MKLVDVFVCEMCGYEDSSFIPSGAVLKEDVKRNDGNILCPSCKSVVKKNIIKKEPGKNMTLKEYLELVKFIEENHSFRNLQGKMIKYIGNTLDFRTGMIHRVKLDDKEFSKTNENAHRNIKEWVMDYLNS